MKWWASSILLCRPCASAVGLTVASARRTPSGEALAHDGCEACGEQHVKAHEYHIANIVAAMVAHARARAEH